MIVIVAAYDALVREESEGAGGAKLSVEERVGKAFARCGLSITLTSRTPGLDVFVPGGRHCALGEKKPYETPYMTRFVIFTRVSAGRTPCNDQFRPAETLLNMTKRVI